MKDQWTVQTDRMIVTLVSEPPKMSLAEAMRLKHMAVEPPNFPSYILLSRPGGGEPVRIEADDAELLMWVLMKLRGAAPCRTMMPMGPYPIGDVIGPG